MGKIKNRKFFIIVVTILICVLIAYLIRLFSSDQNVRMVITPTEMEVGESIEYADSTRGARNWLWEFGNGETSESRSGTYAFKEAGKYMVRLLVNHKLEEKRLVTVRKKLSDYGRESLVKIQAPDISMQGEIISFRGFGSSKEWRWQFGESGIVDSREQNPLYAYTKPGIYEIQLTTEDTKYPVRHTIEVLQQYAENDSTDVLVLIGNDIREHLQQIIDGQPFNTHYNYIMSKYLCSNPDVIVTVNNTKQNDFYSYCQGLKIIARRKTIVNEVLVDMGDDTMGECIVRLLVTQLERPSGSK